MDMIGDKCGEKEMKDFGEMTFETFQVLVSLTGGTIVIKSLLKRGLQESINNSPSDSLKQRIAVAVERMCSCLLEEIGLTSRETMKVKADMKACQKFIPLPPCKTDESWRVGVL